MEGRPDEVAYGLAGIAAERRRRFVAAFGLGYFVLCNAAAPLVHFAVVPQIPYWQDPVMVLAHALGMAALLSYFLMRASIDLAAQLLTWAAWVVVWVAVIASLDLAYAAWLPFYLIVGPLVAGFLLAPEMVVAMGALNLLGVATLGATRAVPQGAAVNVAVLTAAVTLVLGVNAYARRVDERTIRRQATLLGVRAADLDAIMDTASEAMFSMDRWGRVLAANTTAQQVGGPSLRPGASIHDVLPGEMLEHVIRLQQEGQGAQELGEDPAYQVAVRSLAGRRQGFLVTIRDITEERQATERVRLAERQKAEIAKLQEINLFKSDLLRAASHELNTPLTPIRLQLELLMSTERGPLNAKQTRSLDILQRNVSRLSNLVSEILDVSRLQGDKIRVLQQDVQLDDLLRDEVAGYEEPCRRAGLEVQMDLELGVWVQADPRRLRQVINHLLSNAVRYTKEGGIIVRCKRGADVVRVEVDDTGAGVPEDQVHRLFRPFSQLGEAERNVGGTGLGLYVSKGIIDAHGGRIGYERLDDGSRFWFELPAEATVELEA